MLRRLGVLTAPRTETGAPAGTDVPEICPMEASCATESDASPDGSEAAMPRSSFTGLTPMLWKPISCQRPPGSTSTTLPPCACTLETVASVNSPPLWQLVQCPLPWKRSRPRCSCAVSAPRLPSMNWSKRELLETSVDSYICTATPQNMEKLYSICEYSSVFVGWPVWRKLLSLSTTTSEFHHLGWNAAWIIVT